MVDRPRVTLPWMLVAASTLLVAIVLYLLFGAHLPAKKRLVRLETELRDVHALEAQLQAQLAQQEQRQALREQ